MCQKRCLLWRSQQGEVHHVDGFRFRVPTNDFAGKPTAIPDKD